MKNTFVFIVTLSICAISYLSGQINSEILSYSSKYTELSPNYSNANKYFNIIERESKRHFISAENYATYMTEINSILKLHSEYKTICDKISTNANNDLLLNINRRNAIQKKLAFDCKSLIESSKKEFRYLLKLYSENEYSSRFEYIIIKDDNIIKQTLNF